MYDEKRYQLIKEYPGSPKAGHIIKEYDDPGYQNFYHSEKEDEDSFSLRMYPGWYVVNYPEYWKKIVEKDYEILSIYDIFENHIEYADEEGCVNFGEKACIHYMASGSKNYRIHSVKRLIDGSVFRVGDTVESCDDKPTKIIDSIRRFKINEGTIDVYLQESIFVLKLNFIKKII